MIDDDIERDPESEESIQERREYRGKLNRGYQRAVTTDRRAGS